MALVTCGLIAQGRDQLRNFALLPSMGQRFFLFTYLLTYWTLQVRCREVDAGDRRCRWTGRRDQLNQHQHVYDEPAGEQRQGAPAGRKRRAENHDQAPSAKAVRVDDGSRRTSSVPAGTARGRMNESPSDRGTAASAPEPRQPSTSDPRHIRDNDVHEQQQEEEEERDDVVDIVRDAVDAVADLIDDDEWDISVFADTATFRETFRAVADTAVAAGASVGDVGGFVLCSILLVADRIRRRRQ